MFRKSVFSCCLYDLNPCHVVDYMIYSSHLDVSTELTVLHHSQIRRKEKEKELF